MAHHVLDADAELGKIGNSCLKEGDSTLFALIGHDLHKSDARGIAPARSRGDD